MGLLLLAFILILSTNWLMERYNDSIHLPFWVVMIFGFGSSLGFFFWLVHTSYQLIFIIVLLVSCTVIQNRFMYQYRPHKRLNR